MIWRCSLHPSKCTFRGVRLNVVFALVAVGMCSVTLPACLGWDVWIYDCDHPDHPLPSDIGPDGRRDPCHRQDAGAEADVDKWCPPAECVGRPLAWDGPWLLWYGPSGEEPDCPYGGKDGVAWEGGKDLAPLECASCSCGPSVGSCGLPSVLTASTNACTQPGGTSISFDAPMSWDGKCDNMNPIAPGVVQSLTTAPLTIQQEGCTPGPIVTRDVTPNKPFGTFARVCHGQALSCGDPARTCLPPNPAFLRCISFPGDNPCRDVPGWQSAERYVFYAGVDGQGTCSTCTCGPPEGSLCTALLSVYGGSDCNGPAVFHQEQISSANAPCRDLSPPLQALGSKSVTSPTYLAGVCDPIRGTATDNRTLARPMTFCCQQENIP